jgi:hypothetical protein
LVSKASSRSSCIGVRVSISVAAALLRAGSARETEPLDHPRAGGDDPRLPQPGHDRRRDRRAPVLAPCRGLGQRQGERQVGARRRATRAEGPRHGRAHGASDRVARNRPTRLPERRADARARPAGSRVGSPLRVGRSPDGVRGKAGLPRQAGWRPRAAPPANRDRRARACRVGSGSRGRTACRTGGRARPRPGAAGVPSRVASPPAGPSRASTSSCIDIRGTLTRASGINSLLVSRDSLTKVR